MYMYRLLLFSVGTNLGPKFKGFILFSSNFSPASFTIPSLITDQIVSIHHASIFQEILNKQHLAIQYTIEYENGNKS